MMNTVSSSCKLIQCYENDQFGISIVCMKSHFLPYIVISHFHTEREINSQNAPSSKTEALLRSFHL